MKYGTLKKYLTYSAKAFAILSVAAILIFCASWDPDNTVLSSFAPEVIHSDDYKPFFYSHDYFYEGGPFEDHDFLSTNVEDWSVFFDHKVTTGDLNNLLYNADSSLSYINTLIAYTSDKKSPITDALRRNSLNAVSDKQKKLEFLHYLYYARSCEPYVTKFSNTEWGDADVYVDHSLYKDSLIADGADLLKTTRSPFIRQRCHFQIVRLLYMNADFDGCGAYWQAHLAEIEKAGTKSIHYRTMSYAALSLHKSKHFAASNYLYSCIFDSFPIMRRNAMFYFHPVEDSDWHQCLDMARSPHEKAVMWAMIGISKLDELRAIKEIYAIEPSSDLLDLLLVRAANLAEGMGNNEDQMSLSPDSAYNQKAFKFTKEHMSDSRLHDPALWYLCAGFFCKDIKEANTYYDRAIALAPTDTMMQAQAHLLKILYRATPITRIDAHTDSVLLADLRWVDRPHGPIRVSAAQAEVRSFISSLYEKAGNPIMAQIAMHTLWMDYFVRDSNAYRIIAFLDRHDHSPLETYLADRFTTRQAEMWYALGFKDVYRGDLQSAKEKWMNFDAYEKDNKMYADPFIIHIRDCHDCDQAAPQKKKYNRIEFLDKMMELEKAAKADKSKAAESYFAMANGYYNITYWGNNRMFYGNSIFSYYIAASLSMRGYTPSEIAVGDMTTAHDLPADSFHIGGTDMALKYYLKARDASSDKEFKAKCTFMAAKCEGGHYSETMTPGISVNDFYSKYFAELKDKYSNTAYEKELLNECSYFHNYMAHFK